MKLTKNQIDALANKFYNEIKIELDKKLQIKKDEKLKEYKEVYDKSIKVLKDNTFINNVIINIKIGKNTNNITLYPKDTFKDFINNYIFNRLVNDDKISISQIRQDIILATIDSASLDDIMKKLSNKYKQ